MAAVRFDFMHSQVLRRTFCNVLLNELYLGLVEEGTLCVIWVVCGKMGVGN